MTELTMTAPAAAADWSRRAAVAAPLLGVFAIGVGAPLYADDLPTPPPPGRFVLAAATSLAVILLLVLTLLSVHARQAPALGSRASFVVALLGTVMARRRLTRVRCPSSDEAPRARRLAARCWPATCSPTCLRRRGRYARHAAARPLRARLRLLSRLFAILPSPTHPRARRSPRAALLVTRPAPPRP